MTEEERREMAAYRMRLARETQADARLLFENGSWRSAANRFYYAAFYAVNALLIAKEFYPKTHKGSRQIFMLHFVKTGVFTMEVGSAYSWLFDLRHSGDYEDLVEVREGDIAKVLAATEEMIEGAEKHLKTDGWL